VTRFTLKHLFPTDPDTFWAKVFFDAEYNKGLYAALRYKTWEQIERTELPGGKIRRRARMEPGFDAPSILKKVIGDGISYVEEGTFDPATKRWAYAIVPSKMPDRVKTNGEYWLEPRGDKELERICTVNIDASIFGIGGALESYLEKTTRESYETAARFTREFLVKSGLSG
jgi:hypothetical protein